MNRYGRKILRKQQLNIVDSSISKADLILELHERKVTNFLQEQPKGELLNICLLYTSPSPRDRG